MFDFTLTAFCAVRPRLEASAVALPHLIVCKFVFILHNKCEFYHTQQIKISCFLFLHSFQQIILSKLYPSKSMESSSWCYYWKLWIDYKRFQGSSNIFILKECHTRVKYFLKILFQAFGGNERYRGKEARMNLVPRLRKTIAENESFCFCTWQTNLFETQRPKR